MKTSIATVSLSGTLGEKLEAIAAAKFDPAKTGAFHRRRKSAAHCLDFGQFRHCLKACAVAKTLLIPQT